MGRPTAMHDLQQQFATLEGEAEWELRLSDFFARGELDAAAATLEDALAALDDDLARQCLVVGRDGASIEGWPELAEAIEAHEGTPITGAALAIANDADRAFEKGATHHPFMMLGLYSDDAFPFSTATADDILDQMRCEEGPAWAGGDEDIEVYLDIHGLDQLNTALLHHKERHFFRDTAPDRAPARYVGYVLGCWWRALLFQRAVARECAAHGLPGGVSVIAGTVEMRGDCLSVHDTGPKPVVAAIGHEPAIAYAPILASDFIQTRPIEEAEQPSGSDLRRRVAETGQEDEPQPRGLLARFFRRA